MIDYYFPESITQYVRGIARQMAGNMEDQLIDAMATHIFRAAIAEERCGELFNALISGGSATVDAITHKLVIVTENQLSQLIGSASDD